MSTSTAPTAAPTSPASQPLAGVYRACGTIGNVGLPGAPISHYQLLVNPTNGHVSGIVYVTQAIQGPESDITVPVTGTIHQTGLGGNQLLVQLAGDFTYATPPPSIAIIQAHYTAHMVVDKSWNGYGGFEYLNKRVENVPVKSGPCE